MPANAPKTPSSSLPVPARKPSIVVPEAIPANRSSSPKVSLLNNFIVQILIFRKLLLLNDGRDKIMKVAQYSSKILLWLILVEKGINQTRAKQLASHFSLVRKAIRLAHFLEPFNDGLEIAKEKQFGTLQQKLAPLNVVIGICNDISDDIICLAKLGIMDKSWIKTMTPYSDRLWYSGIFIDVHSNICDTNELFQKLANSKDPESRQKLQQKIFMQRVSLLKLLADFVFCTIDVFEMGDRISEGYQHVSADILELTCEVIVQSSVVIEHASVLLRLNDRAVNLISTPMGRFAAKTLKNDYHQPKTTNFEFLGPHGSVFTILLLPLTVLSLYVACSADGCPPSSIYSLRFDSIDLSGLIYDRAAVRAYVGWIAFHLALSICVPGKTVEGTVTPDGKRLQYKINGFNSFLVTMSVLAALVYKHGLHPLLWVADHYIQLAIAGILFAFTLSLALYLRSFRSNQVVVSVCGNSGYPVYDFWMGRELNPRIFGIDLKYVCELRPGLIGWLVLNLALAARQYESHNTLTNSMILVLLGQGYYVVDALWNEGAILTTMDITTDGFGFMLVFGGLPF
ncbi:hypothetical protein HDV01_004390 [Terramyces sp. JEL0728]|nr:hypothetical protein HDV01_004390 [Terramyces sp. JEL0728]